MVENEELGIGLRFTPKGDKPLNQLMPNCLDSLNQPIKPLNQLNRTLKEVEYETLRMNKLYELSQKQKFRVAIGKDTWIDYKDFDAGYNLREILKDEIVIEFDIDALEIVVPAISQTGINLNKAGYSFELWEHGGKSPHLHIHNLPLLKMNDSQRAVFKKMFIKKYVPIEYHPYVDLSLTGIHLIAMENALHWKASLPKTDKDYKADYSYKRLIGRYEHESTNP
jgi:hypothetical protein